MKNRFFLVHYAAYMEDGAQFLGLSTVITEGRFMNRNRFVKDIKEEGKTDGKNIKGVLITHIMELSESDYLDWYE